MYSQLQQNTGVSKYFFCGFFLLENSAFRIQFSVFKIPILVFKTPTSAQCQFNTRKSFQIFCSRHVHVQSALQFRGKKTNLLLSVFLSSKSEVFLGFLGRSLLWWGHDEKCKYCDTVYFYACGKFYTEWKRQKVPFQRPYWGPSLCDLQDGGSVLN